MTERASALGGIFSIEPRPEGGTRVSLEIPVLEEKSGTRMKEEAREKAGPRRKPLRQVKA